MDHSKPLFLFKVSNFLANLCVTTDVAAFFTQQGLSLKKNHP